MALWFIVRWRTTPALSTALVIVLTVSALGWLPFPRHGRAAWAGGVGGQPLTLMVTVNGKPSGGGGAQRPAVRALPARALPARAAPVAEIRTGHPVVKRYVLANRSEADLQQVRLSDPHVPAGALRCPGVRQGTLGMRGLTRVVCSATFPARAGLHTAVVRAEAAIPSLGRHVRATARSGYRGVGGALQLAVIVRDPVGPGVIVRYTVSNRGNRTVHEPGREPGREPGLRPTPSAAPERPTWPGRFADSVRKDMPLPVITVFLLLLTPAIVVLVIRRRP